MRCGGRLTNAGPLAPLMPLRLVELTSDRLQVWLEDESARRGTATALAYRLLRTFIRWCSERPELKGLVDPAALLTRSVRESVQPQRPKTDCLQREQLKPWFCAVRQHISPIIPAYLQALLLTGARREELATLTWDNVDFQWNSLSIRDKVDGLRIIPLTPFVEPICLARCLVANNGYSAVLHPQPAVCGSLTFFTARPSPSPDCRR